MNNLTSISFWFNSHPETITIFGQKVLAIISFVLGVVFIIIFTKSYSERLKLYKPSLEKIIPFCLTNIAISVYIVFVNYELIPVLRSRFWYIIWFIMSFIWLIFIVKDFFKRAKRRESLAKESEIKKYIP